MRTPCGAEPHQERRVHAVAGLVRADHDVVRCAFRLLRGRSDGPSAAPSGVPRRSRPLPWMPETCHRRPARRRGGHPPILRGERALPRLSPCAAHRSRHPAPHRSSPIGAASCTFRRTPHPLRPVLSPGGTGVLDADPRGQAAPMPVDPRPDRLTWCGENKLFSSHGDRLPHGSKARNPLVPPEPGA